MISFPLIKVHLPPLAGVPLNFHLLMALVARVA